MAGLGGGVVVSGVGDIPCRTLQKTVTGNPTQRPRSEPGRQRIANLVEGQTLDGVRWTRIAGLSVGKKRPPLLPPVPLPSTALAFCSDTSGSLGSEPYADGSIAIRGPRNDRSQARPSPL